MLLKMRSARPPDIDKRIGYFLQALSYRVAIPVTKWMQLPVSGYCYPVCPRCEMSMDREYMSFCDRCGQRLSWDFIDHAEIVRVSNQRETRIEDPEES